MVNIVKNTIKDIFSKHPVISGFVTGSALLAFSIIHNIDDFMIHGNLHLVDIIDIIWHISFPITFGFLIGYIGISIKEIRERKKAEAEREKLLHDLSERFKELNCLYNFSKIIEMPNISLEEILQELADVISPGWHYPEITCVRIVLDGQEYKTGNFKETIWRQSGDIQVFGKKVGSLEVYYLEEKPELYEGPFLKEERNLINALVNRLGKVIERIESEEALRDAEQKWTSLTGNTNDTIIITDKNDIIRYVNKTVPPETPEEVIGKTIYEYVSKEHHDVMRNTLKKVYKTREQHSYEVALDMSVINPKIGTLWFNTKVVPIESNKEIHSVIMIATDITERKRAEEIIEVERKKFEDIMENMVDGITLCDMKGKIIYVNKPAIKQLGYTKKEMIGKTPGELFIEKKDLPKFAESVKTIFSGKKIETQEYEARRKNGELFPASVNISPQFDSNGKPIALIAVHRDVTERKRAEEEIKIAKEIAENANRSKSEFLANMSHEIRTPMNGVIGMTELVLDTELTEEQREYLEIVKSSANSLLTVINDVLDFSKIEAGKIELDHIDFSLRDAIGETLKTLGQRAGKKGLELSSDISHDVPDALIGDPGRLRQMIVNLTGNAIKFTEQGEVILIVTQESVSKNDVCIHFAVRDTGIGISPDKLEQVFSAFEQEDGSTTRKYGGTGLGLSITKQLVELMDGKIWVESELEKGSIFHFTAHFDIQSKQIARPVPVEMENLRDLPILVVDDNDTNRRILKKIISNWGMKPTAVGSGKAALETLKKKLNKEKKYKLILVDSLMPEMDGFSLSKKIKDNPEFKDSKIIMLTSSGKQGEAARCRELGIAAYLLKPVSQSELYNAIINTLSSVSLKEKEPSLVTRHSIREKLKRLHILLAEDNLVNQKVATRILEKMGHSVVTAEHGGKALEALGKEHFDLVFMDVQMPEMDGFEATAAIREKEYESGRHIPIIAMTAHAMKGDREKCLEAGMDDYVSKPIKISELNEAIERVLSVDA